MNYDSCSDVQYVQYHYDVGGMQRCNWKEIGVYKDIVPLVFYFFYLEYKDKFEYVYFDYSSVVK